MGIEEEYQGNIDRALMSYSNAFLVSEENLGQENMLSLKLFEIFKEKWK